MLFNRFEVVEFMVDELACNMRDIELQYNSISGSMPATSFMTRLQQLEYFGLGYNKITGT
jgi:hypothetical protein